MKLFSIIGIASLFVLSYGDTIPIDDYTNKASHRLFGRDIDTLRTDRGRDVNFIYIDPLCCCNDEILKIFSQRTKIENKRVNPATDTMLSALGEYEKQIRFAIKETENLMQSNAMYSYTQDVVLALGSGNRIGDSNGSSEGCEPLDFSNEEDRDKYLSVIDKMENGGRGSDAYSLGNLEGGQAFGRYQIMQATASTYCDRTTASLDCCTQWKNIPQCQDEMFELITNDNTQGLMSRGIPLNTCTLYIAHQQGQGGLNWLFGGSNPYGTTERLKNAVFSNLSLSERERLLLSGIDLSSEENLRQIYLDFWNERFKADILSSSGSEYSPIDFGTKADEFIQYAESRKLLWREGILLELKHIIHSMKRK